MKKFQILGFVALLLAVTFAVAFKPVESKAKLFTTTFERNSAADKHIPSSYTTTLSSCDGLSGFTCQVDVAASEIYPSNYTIVAYRNKPKVDNSSTTVYSDVDNPNTSANVIPRSTD